MIPDRSTADGMVVTVMRLVTAGHAACEALRGLVFAKDLPLITGRGLVASRQ